MTDDELKYIECKRLMSILGELNDIEILILISQSIYSHQEGYHDFWKTHKDSLVLPVLLAGETNQEKINKETIHKAHGLHLISLGLLKARFRRSRLGTLPEFDQETGIIKSEGYDITMLGRLLLKSIDQAVQEP
ncbi:hypothetical protein [Candidatus Electronema sp. JM]|uniref:hypothetical protein n=1 Tax=Candidatus Electronema sp. JM TaxID=3401571 RepID=UPI003AA7F5E5